MHSLVFGYSVHIGSVLCGVFVMFACVLTVTEILSKFVNKHFRGCSDVFPLDLVLTQV